MSANRAFALEFLECIRNRLYFGLIDSALNGDYCGGDYGRDDGNRYCGLTQLEKATRWSLQGAYYREKLNVHIDPVLSDKLEDTFYKYNSLHGYVWTANRTLRASTPEKIFALLDQVKEEIEKWE